ncbi:MAG: efflux RND transporter periplasmic adaptor subunit [Mesorhizobium sp.]|nr:efflux RND transporter periplasmic adaptor subunit [Mesorhizobium sp.]MCO5162454.1 efflux RND transporter periplasmic adaptor subunit [Mesorhizobium sp.]
MSFWKQALISLIVLALAFFGWVRFFPGSSEILARWGMDWVPFASVERAPDQPAGSGNGQRQRGSQQAVVAATVTEETINDRLSAIGTGRAKQTVAVTPYAAGRMTEMLVTSGATVKAGDIIAKLDDEAERIAVDRARFALDDAIAKQERMQQLRTSNTATSVQVNEAALAVDNARLALRDAELALARRSIPAPISGVVGILPVAAGNYVSTSTEIARIDNRSSILVDFWVPERYASMVDVGMPLSAASVARPGEVYEGKISALDNRIDDQSRTLQVQALLENPNDRLRAGMSFQVTMEFPGDVYPAVDPLAVQWGSGGAYVWLVRDGKAVRTDVKIIQRNTDTVLVQAAISPGDIVVTEGVHAVRNGAPVTIARTDAPRQTAPAETAATSTSGT